MPGSKRVVHSPFQALVLEVSLHNLTYRKHLWMVILWCRKDVLYTMNGEPVAHKLWLEWNSCHYFQLDMPVDTDGSESPTRTTRSASLLYMIDILLLLFA